jgi:hypothetical protein
MSVRSSTGGADRHLTGYGAKSCSLDEAGQLVEGQGAGKAQHDGAADCPFGMASARRAAAAAPARSSVSTAASCRLPAHCVAAAGPGAAARPARAAVLLG